jgi:protein arginine N-methyltransferase 1
VNEIQLTETNHPGLYYQEMLADERRMRLYREAISRVVRPGQVVADLGTGLGVLAIMAAQAGASRVYAVDIRPQVLPVARRVIEVNGVADRVTLIEGDAREIALDEPVDVIVNELIGDFGTDENIYECVREFAARNLKPEGRIIPERLTTYLVPVEYRDEFRGVYRANYHGLDLRSVLDMPTKAEAIMKGLYHKPKELAPSRVAEDVSFGPDMPPREHRIALSFETDTPGTLQGFVGFFDASLTGELRIRNYPCYPTCHWESWNWPVSPPISVVPGQRIRATLGAREGMVAAGWFLDWKLG